MRQRATRGMAGKKANEKVGVLNKRQSYQDAPPSSSFSFLFLTSCHRFYIEYVFLLRCFWTQRATDLTPLEELKNAHRGISSSSLSNDQMQPLPTLGPDSRPSTLPL